MSAIKINKARDYLKELESARGLPVSGWTNSRETIAKIEAIQGPIATASAPTPADAIAAARSVNSTLDGQAKTIASQKTQLAALNARVDDLMSKLRELKESKAPASAIARAAETATRKTASDLASARRELTGLARTTAAFKAATMTAAEYQAAKAKPTMTREEFQKIPHGQRGETIKNVTLVP